MKMKNRESANLFISMLSFDNGRAISTNLAKYKIEKEGKNDFTILNLTSYLVCKYDNLYDLISCTMNKFVELIEEKSQLIHAYYCTDEEIINATMDYGRSMELRRKENKYEENRYLKIICYPYNRMNSGLLYRMRINEIYKPGDDQEPVAYLFVDLAADGKNYISSNIEETINRFFDTIILDTDYRYGKRIAITSDGKVYHHKIDIDNDYTIEVKFVYYPDIDRIECEEITDVIVKKDPATKQFAGCTSNNFWGLKHVTVEDCISSLLISFGYMKNYDHGKISALFIDGRRMDRFMGKDKNKSYNTEKLMYDFKIINPDAGIEDTSERLFGYYNIIANYITIPDSTGKYLKEEIYEYSIYNLENHIQYPFHKSLKDAIKAEIDRIKKSNDISSDLVVVFKDNREMYFVDEKDSNVDYDLKIVEKCGEDNIDDMRVIEYYDVNYTYITDTVHNTKYFKYQLINKTTGNTSLMYNTLFDAVHAMIKKHRGGGTIIKGTLMAVFNDGQIMTLNGICAEERGCSTLRDADNKKENDSDTIEMNNINCPVFKITEKWKKQILDYSKR